MFITKWKHSDQHFLSQMGCTSYYWAGLIFLCVCDLVNSNHGCCIHGHFVFFCVPGWKNWKGPGNMRPLRRAPLRCDITLLTPLFFFVCTRDILQEKLREKKKKKHHQCKHCNYYYYCSVTGSTAITYTTAFFSHIYSFHWLDFGWRVATSTGL